MPKLMTQPSEKAVFLIAGAGVTFALMALLFVPKIEAKNSEGDSGQYAKTTGPASRAASQPAGGSTSRPSGSQKTSSAPAPRPVAVQEISSSATSEVVSAISGEFFPTERYGALLKTHLSDGMVDYKKLSTTGRGELKALVSIIENTNVDQLNSLPEDEFIAWYINAYNILTLDTIVNSYPVSSIRDLDKPWDTAKTVAGQSLTLNNIEHQILRKVDESDAARIAFMDPRLHFAVNCAAIGCPVLQDTPFTAENTEELYQKGALDFLNNPQRVRLDDGTLHLSQLMDWYGDDFYLVNKAESQPLVDKLRKRGVSNPEKVGSVAWFFSTIADKDLSEKLRAGNYDVAWIEYDWKLNGQ